MRRERERLERLLAMLASESRSGSDLRAPVMARIAAAGAARRRRRATFTLVALLAAGVSAWLGWQGWTASAKREDLGRIGRQGAEWIATPARRTRGVVPVRHVPRRPHDAPVAQAPWGRT